MQRTYKTNVKWTRGRSTVERPTEQKNQIITMKEKAMNLPIKLLNLFSQQKKKK